MGKRFRRQPLLLRGAFVSYPSRVSGVSEPSSGIHLSVAVVDLHQHQLISRTKTKIALLWASETNVSMV